VPSILRRTGDLKELPVLPHGWLCLGNFDDQAAVRTGLAMDGRLAWLRLSRCRDYAVPHRWNS
jgi:hypothetical protein